MHLINSRAAADHMTLNVEKCKVIQCSFGKQTPPPAQISTNGKIVPIVNSLALLGVIFSPSLKWGRHVEGLVGIDPVTRGASSQRSAGLWLVAHTSLLFTLFSSAPHWSMPPQCGTLD